MTTARATPPGAAVVTGAAQGLGLAFARALAARGHDLVLVDVQEARLVEAQRDLARDTGRTVRAVALDLAAPDAAQRLAEATADLDIGVLVANAAYSPIGPFLGLPPEAVERTIAVNCTSVALAAQHFGRRFVERGGGALYLLSSMAGFLGAPGFAAYAASRAYTASLAQSLWSELGPSGVRVLCVAPGATRTPAFVESKPDPRVLRRVPLMEPEAVARGALACRGGPLYIPGPWNRLTRWLVGMLPVPWANRFWASQLAALYPTSAR